MIMVISINVQLFASSFECIGGLIKCSSSFGNMWILVFALLPCVCVTMFKLFNVTLLFVLKFALYPCLFCSLRYTLVCFTVCLTALFVSRKIDDGFFQNLSMNMVISFIVQLFASSFECSGGLIKCSSSFGNMWILVFYPLPCVCVLQYFKLLLGCLRSSLGCLSSEFLRCLSF